MSNIAIILMGFLGLVSLLAFWYKKMRPIARRSARMKNAIKVIISRSYNNYCTCGSLFILAGDLLSYRCKTIELPDKGNQREISCIPEGTYNVVKIKHEKFGNCFHVLNVPGRSGILMHIGNYTAGKKIDTEGCILPGMYFTDINNDGFLDVADSTGAMNKLIGVLPDKFPLYIL